MRLSRNPDLFWDRIDDDMVACSIATGELFRFNKIGHLIWEMCDGCAIEDLVARLQPLFPDSDPGLLAAETRNFVDALLELELLRASAAEAHEKAI